MQNIFVAIGGSGTKVAEALVRLLAIGFPTRVGDDGIVTSSGDTLQIWRVDPDRGSGAAESLKDALRDYKDLQEHLGYSKDSLAGSQWAMEIDTDVRHLDPLLSTNDTARKEAKTLRQILDFGTRGKGTTKPFLDVFYEEKELNVSIDRGFYQKPFIGAAVMAIYAKTLEDENSPGGSKCGLTSLNNRRARFFLCGSLHGGTGACGIPIIGRFLNDARSNHSDRPWKLSACLLAPYSIPPEPPFNALEDEQEVTPEKVEEYLNRYGSNEAFSELSTEERRELIKQILLGFYADPKEMVARARQSLLYYKDHVSMHFDQLYLSGKREPDKLEKWSNGGKKQNNPLNSAEVVAALAAIRFFSDSPSGERDSYLIPTSAKGVNPERIRLHDLPLYTVAGNDGKGISVDPERVFLSTGILHHLIRHQIPWSIEAKRWSGIEGLHKRYQANDSEKEGDHAHYKDATQLMSKFISSLIDTNSTKGWDNDDAAKIKYLLSEDIKDISGVTEKISKKYKFSRDKEAKEPLLLGESSIKVSAEEFGEWIPKEENFTRGDYLRVVWSNLFTQKDQ